MLGTLNMAAFFPLLFLAAQQLPGGVAATLGAAQPIVIAFLAVAILHEKLSLWRVTWGVLGMIGIALVVLGPNAAMSPLGIPAGLAGAVSMGIGVVLTKKWGCPEEVSAVGLAGWQLAAAGLVLLLPALFIDGIPPGIDGAHRDGRRSTPATEKERPCPIMRAAVFRAIGMVRSAIVIEAVHCPFVRACPMIRAASENALGLGPE